MYQEKDDHEGVTVCCVVDDIQLLLLASGHHIIFDSHDDRVPLYGELIFLRLLHTLTGYKKSPPFSIETRARVYFFINSRNNTNVRILAGSIVAYVRSNLVFSKASRFSNPISHAIP